MTEFVYHRGYLESAEDLNPQLLKGFFDAREHWAHSHWVSGRWENTYVNFSHVPALRSLLDTLTEWLSERWGKQLHYLHHPGKPEESSFWFNIAPIGAKTGVHRHSSKASVSAVYYLQAMEGAGSLYFPDTSIEIEPKPGAWVSFLPESPHGVYENKSAEDRISFAFNLYERS